MENVKDGIVSEQSTTTYGRRITVWYVRRAHEVVGEFRREEHAILFDKALTEQEVDKFVETKGA